MALIVAAAATSSGARLPGRLAPRRSRLRRRLPRRPASARRLDPADPPRLGPVRVLRRRLRLAVRAGRTRRRHGYAHRTGVDLRAVRRDRRRDRPRRRRRGLARQAPAGRRSGQRRPPPTPRAVTPHRRAVRDEHALASGARVRACLDRGSYPAPRMPISRRVARFNKHVTNHVTGPFARWLPGFAIVTHVGRRSGTVYHTPVNVFRDGNRYAFALTYGADSDWFATSWPRAAARSRRGAGRCVSSTRSASPTRRAGRCRSPPAGSSGSSTSTSSWRCAGRQTSCPEDGYLDGGRTASRRARLSAGHCCCRS